MYARKFVIFIGAKTKAKTHKNFAEETRKVQVNKIAERFSSAYGLSFRFQNTFAILCRDSLESYTVALGSFSFSCIFCMPCANTRSISICDIAAHMNDFPYGQSRPKTLTNHTHNIKCRNSGQKKVNERAREKRRRSAKIVYISYSTTTAIYLSSEPLKRYYLYISSHLFNIFGQMKNERWKYVVCECVVYTRIGYGYITCVCNRSKWRTKRTSKEKNVEHNNFFIAFNILPLGLCAAASSFLVFSFGYRFRWCYFLLAPLSHSSRLFYGQIIITHNPDLSFFSGWGLWDGNIWSLVFFIYLLTACNKYDVCSLRFILYFFLHFLVRMSFAWFAQAKRDMLCDNALGTKSIKSSSLRRL